MKLTLGCEEEYKKYVDLNSNDSYSKCVVDYADAWATEMEIWIEKGLEVSQCADETSHLVDRLPAYGISGAMYVCCTITC